MHVQALSISTTVSSHEQNVGQSLGAVSPPQRTGISVPLRQKTTISDFLIKPSPGAQAPKSTNAFGQVLTSQDSLKQMKEKQQAKEMKERMLQDKRKMREEKARKSQLKKTQSKSSNMLDVLIKF